MEGGPSGKGAPRLEVPTMLATLTVRLTINISLMVGVPIIATALPQDILWLGLQPQTVQLAPILFSYT